MKRLLPILLFISQISSCQEEPLFQIQENGKFGFINSHGKVIVQPIFLSSGEFSEGLANARLNGTYGYIDKTGNFAIQPQFDYALPFSEGFAVVYKNDHPFFINKNGQKAFNCNFPFIQSFKDGKALVETVTQKFGLINTRGQLVIDTVFSKINPFVDGLAVVESPHHPNRRDGVKEKFEVGVIDASGHFVIPYGKYEAIDDLENGYFKVEIRAERWDTIDGFTQKTGIVDRQGNPVVFRDHSNGSWIDGNINCGLAKMSLYKYWIPEEKGVSFTSEKIYGGFINTKGEITISDTNYASVEDFSNNRAFVKDKNWNYSIINTDGMVISKDAFSRIIGTGFKNGIAFVSDGLKWGVIDTNGNFIVKPQFDGIDEIGMIDEHFFFFKNNTDATSKYQQLAGIADKDGKILVQPILQQYDRSGFHDGLLRCIISDKLTFVNKQGKVVWQQNDLTQNRLANLNIDFMNRGYFYAYSKPNRHDLGGFGESANRPKKISATENFPANELSIIVQPNAKDTFYNRYNGILVNIANTLKNKIEFNAEDSRLFMKVQALNEKGEWKDIEYLPNSWCGNSYHILTLEPQQYWTFVTPVYEGDFKTKLRIELRYIDPYDKSEKRWEKKEITIYSNEYEGSINPGQFWRKQEYYPNGIMDPYID